MVSPLGDIMQAYLQRTKIKTTFVFFAIFYLQYHVPVHNHIQMHFKIGSSFLYLDFLFYLLHTYNATIACKQLRKAMS